MQLNYIYGLVNPETQELRYIGKTTNTLKRYQSHCRAKGNSYRDKWIRSLKDAGLMPEMVIIETCGNDWVEAEKFYIAYFKSLGCLLTNLTAGGEGCEGHKHTDETKRIMRLKKLHKPLSQEHRESLSSAAMGKPKNYVNGKAKRCRVTKPDGEVVETLSLRKFSIDNNLNPSIMAKIARGMVKSHRGYVVEYI